MTTPIIDAHQHFWDPDHGDYEWICGPFAPIRRIFAPGDLRPSLQAQGVNGTILVQTWNDLGETHDFMELAARTDFVAGVVGWVDLTDPALAVLLAELRARPDSKWLVGVRHLIQTEADPEWLLRDDVRRGLRALAEAGLAYDLVPNLPQLPACVRTVGDFPQLRFILDHIAKPDIKHDAFEPWASIMQGFAPHRDHVWCKLSGMITQANWQNWTPADLQPYVSHVLGIFGVERCMFGTDWPVCLVAGSYERVVSALRSCLADRSPAELAQIFGHSAIQAYRLPGIGA